MNCDLGKRIAKNEARRALKYDAPSARDCWNSMYSAARCTPHFGRYERLIIAGKYANWIEYGLEGRMFHVARRAIEENKKRRLISTNARDEFNKINS